MAYQLKCTACGGEVIVSSGQAGGSVPCSCGASLDVPTLRQLRRLPEQTTGQSPRQKRIWTRAQGVMFSTGLFAAVIAGSVAAYTLYWRAQIDVSPIDPKDLQFLFDMDKLTPTQAWEAWTKEFRDYELVRMVPPHEINRGVARQLLTVSIVSGVIAAIGLLMIGASIAGYSRGSSRGIRSRGIRF